MFKFLSFNIWGSFGPWESCGGFEQCLNAEEKFYSSKYFYESRAIIMGLATFFYFNIVFRRLKGELLKAMFGSILISLCWVPAVWYRWGSLRNNTLDVLLLTLLGAFGAYFILRKKRATSTSI